ncbi:MAG: hypothetical protein JXN10_08000 [Clostridia bacterium]|nr:hypothetical protein [Clostridia bacterium]
MKDINKIYNEPHILMRKWKESGEEGFRTEAYKKIRQFISDAGKKELQGLVPNAKTRITVDIAARVNFCGVFTDIPPFCYENGGMVLNAPVMSNGNYPIRVVVSSINKVGFEFKSLPAREQVYIDSDSKLKISDDNDLFKLHRAVCMVCGVGGGISITTESRLPLGSGLGTSSIMAAAIIKGIYNLYGYDGDEMEIVSKVFETEQILGSRGGWQDPFGGLFKGFKVCKGKPGIPLDLSFETISPGSAREAEIKKRIVIFYSGSTRKAGDILADISEEYLIGNEKVIRAYEKGCSLAVEMKDALEEWNLNKFGRLMSEQHKVSKELSPRHSTPEIESLFESLGEISAGSMITGAGGGGYIVVLLKQGYGLMDFERCIGKKITKEIVSLDLESEPYKIYESYL